VRTKIIQDTREWVDISIEKKRIWTTLSILKPTTKQTIQYKAEEINDYFNSITYPKELHNYIPAIQTQIATCHNHLRFKKCITHEFLAWKLIKNKSNPKPDYTGICYKMLNLTIGCPNVNETITHLINLSIQSCQYPECFKTSTIRPIPKCEDPKTTADFRPISSNRIYQNYSKDVSTHLEATHQ